LKLASTSRVGLRVAVSFTAALFEGLESVLVMVGQLPVDHPTIGAGKLCETESCR
jgi:hypothetical protein